MKRVTAAVDQNVRTAASLHPPAGKAARTLPEPVEKQVNGSTEAYEDVRK